MTSREYTDCSLEWCKTRYVYCFVGDWPVCDLFFFLLEVHRAVSKHRELVFHVAAHNAYLPSLQINHVLLSPTAISSPHPCSCCPACRELPGRVQVEITCGHEGQARNRRALLHHVQMSWLSQRNCASLHSKKQHIHSSV